MIWIAIVVLVFGGLFALLKLGRRIQWLNVAVVELKDRQQRHDILLDRLAGRTGGPLLSVEETLEETAEEIDRVLSR